MPIVTVVENVSVDTKTDLGKCLSFSVENVGTVPAWLALDASGARLQLPAGTTRNFPFLQDFYAGEMSILFGNPEADQQQRVNVVKLTHICNEQ